MQKIKIEVGANFGNDTEHLASDGSIVYAFEPTHELLGHLWEKFKHNTNVKVLPFAIDTQNGFANFKIAGHHDWGYSSLYDFSGDWEREDFYVSHEYQVPKITLYDFCNMYNISKIDYLWIDARGNDFNCLLSLGEKIDIVSAGQCEVSMDKILYTNSENHISIVKPWLESKGFSVEIELDGTGAECNLKFRRNAIKTEHANILINKYHASEVGELAILPILNQSSSYSIVHRSNSNLVGDLKIEIRINGVLFKTYKILDEVFYTLLKKTPGFTEISVISGERVILSIKENRESFNNLEDNGLIEIIKPRISVYALCWNEEKLLPHFLNHYSSFASKITIFDNMSSDSSVDIIRSFKGCKTHIIQYESGGTLNDFKYLEIKNNCWKSDPSEYVVVSDLDEFLYFEDIDKYLKENSEYDLHTPNGYDMVSETYPKYESKITQQVTHGFYHTGLCKTILFKPNSIFDINYLPGAHSVIPLGYGIINKSGDDSLKLLHYKRLSLEHMISRYELFKSRMSEANLRLGAGSHYLKTAADVEMDFNDSLSRCTQILSENIL